MPDLRYTIIGWIGTPIPDHDPYENYVPVHIERPNPYYLFLRQLIRRLRYWK